MLRILLSFFNPRSFLSLYFRFNLTQRNSASYKFISPLGRLLYWVLWLKFLRNSLSLFIKRVRSFPNDYECIIYHCRRLERLLICAQYVQDWVKLLEARFVHALVFVLDGFNMLQQFSLLLLLLIHSVPDSLLHRNFWLREPSQRIWVFPHEH